MFSARGLMTEQMPGQEFLRTVTGIERGTMAVSSFDRFNFQDRNLLSTVGYRTYGLSSCVCVTGFYTAKRKSGVFIAHYNPFTVTKISDDIESLNSKGLESLSILVVPGSDPAQKTLDSVTKGFMNIDKYYPDYPFSTCYNDPISPGSVSVVSKIFGVSNDGQVYIFV